MTKYLLTYYIDNEFCTELATMQRIAEIIGCRDFNETLQQKVYRMLPSGVTPLQIGDSHRDLTVSLFDRFGNLVDSAEYPDH